MRKPDTTGEYAIPNVEARVASRAHDVPMDSDAFAGFYQRSAPALRVYLMRVSGNSALAEDLTQESYLRFLCASQPEGGEVNWRRYLFRIATNLLTDYWRSPRAASIEERVDQTRDQHRAEGCQQLRAREPCEQEADQSGGGDRHEDAARDDEGRAALLDAKGA